MSVLTVNVGSSSVRLGAYDRGGCLASTRLSDRNADPAQEIGKFAAQAGGGEIAAVAHRVVHGGDEYTAPVRIDAEVERRVEALGALAPLHNPAALKWIRAAREVLGGRALQVAVFDTAFFATLPVVARTYALPSAYGHYRRYGFHGLAHRNLWRQFGRATGRIISLQLGAGCSIAAIRDGVAVDTSMGFSPLEGLVMATRCGDVDPGLLLHLLRTEGLSGDALDRLLNHESGLLGVSGFSADMRELLSSNEESAKLAVELYCYRACKYIGAYLAVLGGADAIFFAGGVGGNSPAVRAEILQRFQWAGIELDDERNRSMVDRAGRIDSARSKVAVHVAVVDEGAILAQAAWSFIK